MYKVYHDPKGERYLEKSRDEPDKHVSHQYSEEDYKKKIQNLNIEIKGLNEQLDKVHKHICHNVSIKVTPL